MVSWVMATPLWSAPHTSRILASSSDDGRGLEGENIITYYMYLHTAIYIIMYTYMYVLYCIIYNVHAMYMYMYMTHTCPSTLYVLRGSLTV